MNQLILKTKDNAKLLPLINEALENKSALLILSINQIQNILVCREYAKSFN